MKLLRVLKETFFASLPLAVIIIIVCGFVAPMGSMFGYLKLVIGYAGVVTGQTIFLVGLDDSILPIGRAVGESLVNLKKVIFIVFFGVLFGFLAETAEPTLTVFAHQVNLAVDYIDEWTFIIVMATGVGAFVGFGLYRVLKDINIKVVFGILYAAIFLFAIFTPTEFVGIAFDGSSATTGDISVPFILALSIGVSTTLSKRKSADDVFGIIGLSMVGPILAVFVFELILKAVHGGVVPISNLDYAPGAVDSLLDVALVHLRGASFALLPIVLAFVLFNFILLKLRRKDFARILLGIVPVFAGHLIFLTCVDFGFAYAGQHIGSSFFANHQPDWYRWLLFVVAFVLGGAIALVEPAITVLGNQLEMITNGHIKKMTIRITLAIGLGFASALSIAKIITQLDILWFLIPLYATALIMMKFSSKMFVGLAFDSGGFAAGGLSAAFLTPFALGVAQAMNESTRAAGGTPQSILISGFSIIAFMAVMPLIAVQTLGLIYEWKFKRIRELLEIEELMDLDSLTHRSKSEPSIAERDE